LPSSFDNYRITWQSVCYYRHCEEALRGNLFVFSFNS
jgi:hypothetical protein